MTSRRTRRSRPTTLDISHVLGHIQALHRVGPRSLGEPGHRAAQGLLRAALEPLADRYREHVFTEIYHGAPVECRNLWARHDGERPGRVLLAAHYDAHPVAGRDPDPSRRTWPAPSANAGSSGAALLLELAARLHRDRRRPTVDIVLFDAEDVHGCSGKLISLGSRRFRRWLPADERPDMAVVLGAVATRGCGFPFDLRSLRHGPSADLGWRLFELGEKLGLEPFWPGRWSPPDDRSIGDEAPLRWLGCPAVQLSDRDHTTWHTTADTPDRCDPHALADVGAFLEALVLESHAERLCQRYRSRPCTAPGHRSNHPGALHPLDRQRPVLPPGPTPLPRALRELQDEFLRVFMISGWIDRTWVEYAPTRITWWTGGPPLTIVPAPAGNSAESDPWMRCFARTVVASSVGPSPGLFAALADFNRRHDLCVALWSDATATVGLHSSVMVVGSQLVGSAAILAHSCAAQSGSWRELVDLITPHLGAHRRPQTEHPRRGPAPPRQRGLDLDARLALPPRTDPESVLASFDELPGTLAEDFESVISAGRSERGITLEVDFPGPAGPAGHPVPARVHAGLETEGPLGPALTIALELPCDPLDDLTANQLNVWEMNDNAIGFMLGGWRSGPDAPTLDFRVPLTAVFPAFAHVLTTDAVLRAIHHGYRLQRAAREPLTN